MICSHESINNEYILGLQLKIPLANFCRGKIFNWQFFIFHQHFASRKERSSSPGVITLTLCTGGRAECPESTKVANGTFCQNYGFTCVNGVRTVTLASYRAVGNVTLDKEHFAKTMDSPV